MVDYSNTRPEYRLDYANRRPNEGAIGFGVYLSAGLIVAVLLFALFGDGSGAVDSGIYAAPDAIDGGTAPIQAQPVINQ